MFGSISDKFDSILKKIRGVGVINDSNINETIREIRRALIDADVSFKVTKNFVDSVKTKAQGVKVLKSIKPGEQFVKILRDELVVLLGAKSIDLNLKSDPSVVLLAGLQGAGKTTTTIKLANRFKKKGKNVLVVAADTYRPGAIDQLDILAKSINVPIYKETNSNPIKICRNALEYVKDKTIELILIDTAGRLHLNSDMMLEIKNISELTKPDEILFVADGMTGQDAVNSAKQFNKDLSLSGIVLTKMDGDAKGGAAVSIKEIIGKPIKFIGTSEKIDGLDLFDPERIADRILGYGDVVALVKKAQTLFDDKNAKHLEESIKRNTFTLDDYKKQLIQIKKMGSINDIMKMLPIKMKNIHTDEKSLIWVEAIINSMTKYERKNPSVLDGSRRLRISKGSGRSVQEVNALLNQFSKMQKVMRKMGKMNKKRIPNFGSMFGFK